MATQPQSECTPHLVTVAFTGDDLSLLRNIASRRGQSLAEFTSQAALAAAAQASDEERMAPYEYHPVEHSYGEPLKGEAFHQALRQARASMRVANPAGRDLAAELIAERRAEAARE